MRKYFFILILCFAGYSTPGLADGEVSYGYDKKNSVIFAKKSGKKEMVKFNESYTGNPSYLFDFFSGAPAIIADSRSLYDSTIYITLKVRRGEFIIDCLYSNVKSKKMELWIKRGFVVLMRHLLKSILIL